MKTGRFIDAQGLRAEVSATQAPGAGMAAEGEPVSPSIEIKITGEGRLTPANWVEFSERVARAIEELEGRR
jgi:hypothetical protein